MKLAALASSIHKWLALIVGVQILFWFVSGLFFTLYPIERVRSEHRIAEAAPVALDLSAAPMPLAAAMPEAPVRLTYERTPAGEAVAVAEFAERRPLVIDIADWRVISPLSEQAAADIASAYIAGAPRVRERTLVTEESAEYRGALPAWRIAFEDREGLVVYVAADTARVTARRSDLWRVYDALWALHIMDWRDHENFNHGLIILAAALGLVVTLAGIVLIPYRMRFGRRAA